MRDPAARSGSRRPMRGVAGPARREIPPPRPPARPIAFARRTQRPVRRSGFVSAGQILGVALICFAAWTLFDARQLLNSASGSPLGVRRSVAMSLLRPIARVNEVFGLDRLVNGGNRALGRDGTFTPGAGTALPPIAPPSTAVATKPSTPGKHPQTAPVGTTGAQTVVLPPLTDPTSAHPLTVLQIGDSIGEDLGIGLGDVAGSDKKLNLILKAVGNTGLSNTAYYDWPGTLSSELKMYHPGLVVVMMGGNDWQPFYVGKIPAEPGTKLWQASYSARVGEMMDEATASGAHVLWVGLPIMALSSGLATAAVQLNAIYSHEAATHPGVIYYSAYKLFQAKNGQYSAILPDAQGNLVTVRDPDGVHIAPPAGDDFIARAVAEAIGKDFEIKL